MNALTDTVIIVALLNLVSMFGNVAGNVYYNIKMREARANGELISYWKGKCEELEDKIHDMHKAKNNYRRQYENVLLENQKLQGKLDKVQN